MWIYNEVLRLSRENVSDIHIMEDTRFAYRSGSGIEISDRIPDMNDIISFMDRIGMRALTDEVRRKCSIDFSFSTGHTRYRGNIFLSNDRTGMVLRIIENRIKTFEELGLPQQISRICNFKSGIVIITGPTGSGKSSTMAALIEKINSTMNKHIITLEDPIEYIYTEKKSIITQRELGRDFFSYNEALKSSLRQDPDVIAVGEIRDRETLNTAMTAAETGHLCFCTLHTLGASSTIDRIIDMFDEDERRQVTYQLSRVLKSIVSQQLVDCSGMDGESGRCVKPVIDLLFVDKAVETMIKDGKTNQINNYILTNGSKGNLSMDRNLIEMYRNRELVSEKSVEYAIDEKYVLKHMDSGMKDLWK